MKRIKVIFLDAGGTLFEVRGSVGKIYSRIARRHGIQMDPRILDDRFQKALVKSWRGFPPASDHESQPAEGPSSQKTSNRRT